MEANSCAPLHKRGDPPNHANAHEEAHRRPSRTTVANDFSLIVLPISIPATRFPPALLNTTRALVSRPTSVRNWLWSPAWNSPSTVTKACAGSSPNGDSEILAAKLDVLQRHSTAAKLRTALKLGSAN